MSERVKLLPHQQQVFDETKPFNRVAYYLDMGLGKTYVGSEKFKDLGLTRGVLLCQKSKRRDWKEHFNKYYPEYNVTIVESTMKIDLSQMGENDIYIMTYDLTWRRPALSELRNYTLMMDESQHIKNPNNKRGKFITTKMKFTNLIMLSGTPINGKYEEIWSQANMLGWKISKKDFYDRYCVEITINLGFPKKIVVGYKNIDELKDKLREYGGIFLKGDIGIEQMDIPVNIPNTKEYKQFNKDRLITIDGRELVGDHQLTYELYLRQLASIWNAHKREYCEDLLNSTSDRFVIFYNFNEELEILKDIAKKTGRKYSTINAKSDDLTTFRSESNGLVFCQYQCGSEGHNLQEANRTIYYSPPNGIADKFDQSKKRTHRLGQTNTCYYYYLITENSIEVDKYKDLNVKVDRTDFLFDNTVKIGGI